MEDEGYDEEEEFAHGGKEKFLHTQKIECVKDAVGEDVAKA